MVKVSVIIPNYNHASYLKQRLDTVLAQTYQDFEVIILDDMSADNSRDIIEQYRQHPKVSNITYNHVNSGGPFNQWKKGIELAKGDYIWIAESDDWCENTLLETLVEGLDGNGQCVLAYAQTYTVNQKNEIEQVSSHNKLAEYVKGTTYIKEYLTTGCSIWNASMALFKKEAYKNVSQTFTGFKMSGDWLFYIELARQGDVFISGRVLNYFRNHDKDVSGKMYATGKNYIEELQILKILKNEGLICYADFKKHLLDKYIKFMVFKNRFPADVQQNLKECFYRDGEISMKGFLKMQGNINLFKIKLRRRLNLLIK
jgi:glycosyltransferase involved in cell wall biosynthesis